MQPTDKFKFGTLSHSALSQLFDKSDVEDYMRVSKFIQKYNFQSTSDGVKQLKDGYAIICFTRFFNKADHVIFCLDPSIYMN